MTQKEALFPTFSCGNVKHARPLKALINIASFKKNIDIIKGNINASELIIVVKADAYGHGLIELSQAANGCNLAVAVPDELIQLREAGIDNQIWVLEGPFSLDCLSRSHKVTWVVHSFWQIDLIKTALNKGIVSELSICIKLDTGMRRLGFVETELTRLQASLAELSQVTLVSVMSHFTQSEKVAQESVFRQINQFDKMVRVCDWGEVKQTLANSGGIMLYPESHRDWVRPGIMLYSGESLASSFDGLEPVMSLESSIISLRTVKGGESVGYGGNWVANADSVIATVAAGYADGYPRHAPNGTPVAVIGKGGEVNIARLVGRVSMDMLAIDVSSIASVAIGDKVELWGKTISVGEVARLSGTISYELLTSINKRVPKLYIE